MAQRTESVETSDSSHSGIVAGLQCWRRVGLDGAEQVMKAWWEPKNVLLGRDSRKGFLFDPLVGEEMGGVTGALLDIRRGGNEDGTEVKLWRKGRMASPRDGLRFGLAW